MSHGQAATARLTDACRPRASYETALTPHRVSRVVRVKGEGLTVFTARHGSVDMLDKTPL